jgi:hypothetical protein
VAAPSERVWLSITDSAPDNASSFYDRDQEYHLTSVDPTKLERQT